MFASLFGKKEKEVEKPFYDTFSREYSFTKECRAAADKFYDTGYKYEKDPNIITYYDADKAREKFIIECAPSNAEWMRTRLPILFKGGRKSSKKISRRSNKIGRKSRRRSTKYRRRSLQRSTKRHRKH